MKKIRLIIVDDHKMFRDGIKFILEEIENVEVVAEASNGEELLSILKVIKPDMILMDINMPVMNGIDATKKAFEIYPDMKILVLSMFGDEAYYNSMIDLGVQGFVLKDADIEELRDAIQRIADGNTYFSQDL